MAEDPLKSRYFARRGRIVVYTNAKPKEVLQMVSTSLEEGQ